VSAGGGERDCVLLLLLLVVAVVGVRGARGDRDMNERRFCVERPNNITLNMKCGCQGNPKHAAKNFPSSCEAINQSKVCNTSGDERLAIPSTAETRRFFLRSGLTWRYHTATWNLCWHRNDTYRDPVNFNPAPNAVRDHDSPHSTIRSPRLSQVAWYSPLPSHGLTVLE
jgi:hypothetical protein